MSSIGRPASSAAGASCRSDLVRSIVRGDPSNGSKSRIRRRRPSARGRGKVVLNRQVAAYHEAGGRSADWSGRLQCRWNESSVQQARGPLGGPQNGRPQKPPMKRPATAPGGPATNKPVPAPARAPIKSARAGRAANEKAANTDNVRIAFFMTSSSRHQPL
jgi:hypothetical protein